MRQSEARSRLAALVGEVNRKRSKDDIASAFSELVEYVRPLETSQPSDEKNVQYYEDRFANAETVKHMRWWVGAFHSYAKGLVP